MANRGDRGRRGGGSLIRLALFLILLLVAFSLLRNLFQGQGSGSGTPAAPAAEVTGVSSTSAAEAIAAGSGVQTGWAVEANTAEEVQEETAPQARERFTKIKGDGKDTVTILVYMCGTDLESKSAMGTNDLNEMLKADVGDNVNLLIYTGGCKRWRNNVISSSVNQVYRISHGQIQCVVENDGNKLMTDPATLEAFIRWGAKNYPANRMELILWDHGTGSVTGYGYDEKSARASSMTLAGIKSALNNAGVKFDMIGFDACLMATAENAVMLGEYADYMVASEETEPGVGWYYTDWLNALSANTSMPTVELGKMIVDSFVAVCRRQTPGQSTTLSVVDLAEFSQTFPPAMSAFSTNTTELISSGYYNQVARARSMTKEFARGNKLDQIDLIHFASLLNTKDSNALVDTVRSAVKYNRTSSDVANAYGLSIYFPYASFRSVNSAANIFASIGMTAEYANLFQRFAQMQASGQSVTGGGSTPWYSLYGDSGSSGSSGGYTGGSGSSYSSSYELSEEDMLEILSLLLGGRYQDVSKLHLDGLTEENSAFLAEGELDPQAILAEVSQNRIQDEDLLWKENSSGEKVLILTDEQWSLISRIDKAMFVDDGEGYVELGLDNIYDWDADDNLLPDDTDYWLAVNGQPVAYYHTETLDISDEEYTIRGTIPVLLNGDRADLLVVFDNENENGYIAGATFVYEDTDAVAKNMEGLQEGDTIDFLAGCYGEDGSFQGNYKIGKQLVVGDPAEIVISDIKVSGDSVKYAYCLTDVYGKQFWTEAVEK